MVKEREKGKRGQSPASSGIDTMHGRKGGRTRRMRKRWSSEGMGDCGVVKALTKRGRALRCKAVNHYVKGLSECGNRASCNGCCGNL